MSTRPSHQRIRFFNNFKFLQSWNREWILFSLLRNMIIRLFPNGSTRNRRLQTLHPGRGATSDAWNRVSMMTLVFKAENRTAQLSAHPQGYDWALLMWQWWNEQQTQRRAVIRYAKMSFVNIFILGYISSIFFGISLLRKQSSPACSEAFLLIHLEVFLYGCNMHSGLP